MLNPFADINWKPERKEMNKFALSLMIGFPCIALIFALVAWVRGAGLTAFPLWLGGTGLVAGALLRILPSVVVRPFYLAWYFLAACMGLVMGNVIFGLFYYALFTPIGMIVRALGKLSLKKGFDPKAATYWQDAEKSVDPARYYRQF